MSRRRTFGSIRKLSSGRYQARYTSPDGARHRAPRSFATKAEASRWLASSENDLARGTWTDPDAARVALDVYAHGWLRSRPNLRPRTVDLYENLLERHIIPVLGHHSLGTLTPATVRRWNADLVQCCGGGSLTPAKSYRLLRTILNTALADGLISRNPCAIVGAGVERSVERPVATLAQVWALADAVDARFRALVLTAAFAGLRFGELAALTRGCVNLDDGTVTVVQSLVERDDGSLAIGPPKSEPAAGRSRCRPFSCLSSRRTSSATSAPTTKRSSSSAPRARGCVERTGRRCGEKPRGQLVSKDCGSTISGTPATRLRPRPARAHAS
jgi:Phage integrase, N-terminal SAM-like domain